MFSIQGTPKDVLQVSADRKDLPTEAPHILTSADPVVVPVVIPKEEEKSAAADGGK